MAPTSRGHGMKLKQPGTWRTGWAFTVIQEEDPLGNGFGNKLATALPV